MMHEILGVGPDADQAAIKKAYLAKVKEFPPDKSPEEFKKIRHAYDILRKGGTKASQFESLRADWKTYQFEESDIVSIWQALDRELTLDEMLRLTF